MERFLTYWRWIEHIGGLLLTICTALFVVHSFATGNLLSLEGFGRFLDGLLKYILN